MADFLDLLPRWLIVAVVAPPLVGVALLALLFELDALTWAILLVFLLGGFIVIGFVVGRAVLLERQRENPEDAGG